MWFKSIKKRGYYIFYLIKNTLNSFKEQEIIESEFQKTFQLNQNDLIEVLKLKKQKQ
jgi:hypothetical protein